MSDWIIQIICYLGLQDICIHMTEFNIALDSVINNAISFFKQFKFQYIINIGLLATFIGLITTWYKNWKDSLYKRSDFFLMEVKSYFDNAIRLISEGNNNHVKWHNAIYSLKRAIEIAQYITQNEHKKIYVTKYIDSTYKIGNIIKEVDSFKFFYGHTDYLKIGAKELHPSSKSPSSYSLDFDKHPPEDKTYDQTYRISTNGLSFLCRFLHKSNEIDTNMRYCLSNYSHYDSAYEFNHLSTNINDRELSQEEMYWLYSLYPQIIDYIRDYQLYEKAKYKPVEERA